MRSAWERCKQGAEAPDLALAVGCMLAGSLMIPGAARNVTVILRDEARGGTLTFFESDNAEMP